MAYSKDVLKNVINEFGNLVASGSTNMKTLYLYHSLVTNPSNVHQIIQIPELLQTIANNGSTIGAYLLARHGKYAQSEDLAKYIAESVDAMNHIALNDTLRSFVRKEPVLWDAVSKNDMAIAKWIAGAAGLDPTAYSDLNTLLKDTSVFDNILNSSTACQVVHEIEPKWLPISDWDTAQVAFYPFEGNANDAFGNYDGTWHGNEQYEASPWGQAAKFDGSSYIETVFDSNSLEAVSYSFCLSFSSTNEMKILGFSGSSDMAVQILKGGTDCRVYFRSNLNFSDIPNFFVNDSTWHCYLITISNTGTKHYRDGILKGSSSQAISSVSPPFTIGDVFADSPYPYIGLLDNLRIFNRALTDEEVQRIYLYEKNAGGL